MTEDAWQYVRDETGKEAFVVVPVDRFRKIEAAAQKTHDFKQLSKLFQIEQDANDLIPADVIRDIAEGIHPVRAWRNFKKLKAVELASQSGISPAYLSEIETGKKDGTFKTMAAIAICLGVKLDDLVPVTDPAERTSRVRRARRTNIINQIRQLQSMMNDDRPFDTAAVRETSERLSKLAIEAGMDGQLDEEWLALVYDVANTLIERTNYAEQRIIDTASVTRRELVGQFSSQLAAISDK